jgi:photosystem II stability/assembly factor-like uncharacterized protein
MHRDDVRGALEAMASAVPAPSTDATATIARGQRRVRQRRLTLVGVVALLAAIVVAAGAIASTGGNGTPHVEAPVTTTLPLIHVGPGTTIATKQTYTGPTPIAIAFASATEGWLCSASNMAYTQTAGTNWRYLKVQAYYPAAPRFQFPVCAAVPGGDAWMITTGHDDGLQVAHVSGGGREVETADLPALPGDWTVRDLAFSDSNHGWAFAHDTSGAATVMFVTTDGGRTWADEKPARRSTLFATSTEGWAVPDISPNELTHTMDGGRTWAQGMSAGLDNTALRPLAATGDTVVALATSTEGGIIQPSFEVSTDAGNSWIGRPGPPNIGAGDTVPLVASAVDADHWQIGARNQLFTTGDGGRTWTRVAEFAGISEITDVHFLTPETGFVSATGAGAVAGGTVVLQTTDGGDTWAPIESDAPPLTSGATGVNTPGGLFGCPTHPLAPAPPGNPPLGLVEAAVHDIETVRGWTPVGKPVAYRVGATAGSFSEVFNFQIPSCGADTVAASWVVELQAAPGSGGGGSTPQAQIVLANSPDGWRVYGRYH